MNCKSRLLTISFAATLWAVVMGAAQTAIAELPRHMESSSSQIDSVTEIPKWVDLRAVWERVAPGTARNRYVAQIMGVFRAHSQTYFGRGVKFSDEGVGRRSPQISRRRARDARDPSWCDGQKSLCYDQIYGVEITGNSRVLDGEIRVPIIALFHSSRVLRRKPLSQRFMFRRMTVIFDRESRPSIKGFVRGADIPLYRTRFSVRAGISDRRVVLEDSRYGIKKIYPIAAGALNRLSPLGDVNSLTPRFSSAYISRAKARSLRERCDPDYFECRPFVPIQRRGERYRTSIGFHIQQNRGAFPGAGLKRGFFSHGCMRMLERDLFEMYAIVVGQQLSRTPVRVQLSLMDGMEHPYPLTDDRFSEVINGGTGTAPRARRDQNGLVSLRSVDRDVPLESLVPRRRTLDEMERYRPPRNRSSRTTRTSRPTPRLKLRAAPAPRPVRQLRRRPRVAAVRRPTVRRQTRPPRAPEHNVLGLGTRAPNVN